MAKAYHDSETLAKGQQVLTVCCFIHKKIKGIDKVFLAKRADSKRFLPGLYELPGGHVEFGEDLINALKREVKEELAVPVNVGDPFTCYTYQNLVKASQSIEVVYFATFF
ncbi:MAG: NUDIX hydrolase [Candidatus Saccharimonadales bacterium]